MKKLIKWFLLYIAAAVAVCIAFCPFYVTTRMTEQEAELALKKADLEFKMKEEANSDSKQLAKMLKAKQTALISESTKRSHKLDNFVFTIAVLICLGIPTTVIVYSKEVENALRSLGKVKKTLALSAVGVILALLFSSLGAALGIFRF